MNMFALMGNLTKDPETRPASGNGSFTTFCIAVNDGFGEKKKTYFLECAAGGKAGENIAKFFKKGKPIIVEGKMYTGENRKTGFQEIRLSVYKFHFVPSDSSQGGGNGGNGGGNQGGGNGGNSGYGNNQQNNNRQNNQQNNQQNNGGNQGGNQGGGYGGDQQGPVDDIPF